MAAGVAVMGHCGLLPQSISVLGGFRPQGQSAAEALRVVHEARVRRSCCVEGTLHCNPSGNGQPAPVLPADALPCF